MPLAAPPQVNGHGQCAYAPSGFRLVMGPVPSLPPNHLLLYSMCPCGRHRIYFTMHRNLLLAHVARNPVGHNARVLPHVQRTAEIQNQMRGRQIYYKDDYDFSASESESEDVDR